MGTAIKPPRDPNTLSNYNNWRTTHTAANLHVCFDEQRLKGSVSLQLKSITDAETREVILDSSYLEISQVKVNDQVSKWDLLPRLEPYGEALKIQLDKGVAHGQSVTVSIDVSTTKSCTALQWLTPAQTASKKQPYMFSQCQAIHARSIFPCQDTPDVKSTFDFTITSPLPVVASGLPDKSNPTPSNTGPQVYRFHQPVPIPSYLFALASGEIASSPIGPRSTVATDPLSLASCTWELSPSTESFIRAAESLIYPYAWHQYNVLVLPPSFPYGGMENPVYTFATPTIISGDRENVDVIAHELSHSWSGNLVSTCSWEHFWLNEGWTTYLERRIQALVHGSDAWRDFSAIIGWKALADSVAQFGEQHEFTKLIPDLKGKDPDDAFSSVPYEKGFNFLYFIEKLIGIEKFDTFIPHYFTVWKEKSLDSYDFKATLVDFFAKDTAVSKKLAEGLDWDTWFYAPGFPPKPDFDTSLVEGVYKLADKWETLTQEASVTQEPSTEAFEPSKSDIDGLTANQLVVFLERALLFPNPLAATSARKMGQLYGFTKSRNVELVSRYCQIAMKAGDEGCLDTVTGLLARVGRMKFVRPLYKGLIKVDRALAEKTFDKNRDFYHPICRAMVEKILEKETEGGGGELTPAADRT
jgi:leukotriene-A4 hydrolase